MPRFSVVIPTFNRASKLSLAITSVLNQTLGDFELVISNGGSTDNTSEVVQGFDDPRILYLDSSVRLSAAENYQQGLNAASGEFVTFLSDDDAYTPYLLHRVNQVIQDHSAKIVGYQYCRYYHEDLYDFEINVPKNSLLVAKFDRQVTHFAAQQALGEIYALHGLNSAQPNPQFICPYLSNATYHRSIFEALKERRNNLFDQVPADIYLAAAVFYVAEDYYCLNEPLLVWSNWEGNATASAQRPTTLLRDHYNRLLNGRELEHTPLKFSLQMNCAVNAILEAASDFKSGPGINWVEYFVRTYENFVYLRSVGVDTSEEEREFQSVLTLQTANVQRQVRASIYAPMFASKSFVNTRMPRVAATLRRIFGARRADTPKLILGTECGFRDVVEASRYVDEAFPHGKNKLV